MLRPSCWRASSHSSRIDIDGALSHRRGREPATSVCRADVRALADARDLGAMCRLAGERPGAADVLFVRRRMPDASLVVTCVDGTDASLASRRGQLLRRIRAITFDLV